MFKTKSKLNYHEVIHAVEHDKKLKTNTKTYKLTSYGRELAVDLLKYRLVTITGFAGYSRDMSFLQSEISKVFYEISFPNPDLR